MRTEQQLNTLEEEIKAIKTSFQQTASMMDVYTTILDFSTSPNIVRWNGNGHWEPLKYPWLDSLSGISSDSSGNYTGYGRERVVVTFNCSGGINTFASLEMDLIEANGNAVWCKRVPYDGGARWVVLFHANEERDGQGRWVSWKPTVVRFAVESAIPGTLEARMIWQ